VTAAGLDPETPGVRFARGARIVALALWVTAFVPWVLGMVLPFEATAWPVPPLTKVSAVPTAIALCATLFAYQTGAALHLDPALPRLSRVALGVWYALLTVPTVFILLLIVLFGTGLYCWPALIAGVLFGYEVPSY